jgi:hypothetical protein
MLALARLLLAVTVAAVVFLAVAPGAGAAPPTVFGPVAGNPADRLMGVPIEPPVYDPASRCTPKAARPGVDAFVRWLDANAGGAFWGVYRCEKWGPGSASLHAEKRAVDWHLAAARAADRREAARLIRLLLAPDAAGNWHALARRMGVEEIIWDCGYWGAGMGGFRPYGPCFDKAGRPRRVDVTTAHRDHLHLGLSRAGAMGRTSFWRR